MTNIYTVLRMLLFFVAFISLQACLNNPFGESSNSRIDFNYNTSPYVSAPSLSYLGSISTMGVVGIPMSVSPTFLNYGGEEINACTSNPALPSWASINQKTCVISGVPTSTFPSTSFIITVSNSVGKSQATLSISVVDSAPVISYYEAAGTNGSVGVAMSVSPTTLNNQGASITSCSASPALPAWASLNSSTCVISGTPTAVIPATPFAITAVNSAGSATSSVTLSVAASAPIISFSGATGTSGSVGVAMSVAPTTLNNQGAVITSCSATPALPAWASINSSTCEIIGTPTATLSSTSYTITAANSAGSATSSVSLAVAASGPLISYSGATGTSGSVGVAMSVSPTTLNNQGASITSCNATPALPVWASINSSTCEISGTPTAILSSTSYTITATNSAGSSNSSVSLSVSASVPNLSYLGSLGTNGAVGVPLAVNPSFITSNGSAITSCSASPALPTGLVLNSSTCVISGTPTVVSFATIYSITAANAAGSGTASVTLSVSASAPAISYSGATGTSGSVGVAMSVSPTTLLDHGSVITSCSISPALPAWASINSSTCVISGTPTAVFSSTSYTVTATNSVGSSSSYVALSAAASTPIISYSGATGTSGSVGLAISVSPTNLNSRGSVITACSASPALPAWASIDNATCVISGTPTTVLSSASYTITTTNSAGSATSSVTLSVAASAPAISYSGATGTSGSVGVAMSVSPPTLNNQGAAITSCSASPALPAWASINSSTCVISGTPTSALNSTLYTITAINSVGSATSSVTLSVAASAPIISYSGATGTSGSFGVAMSVAPTTLNNQGAVITSCSANPALPAWASINSSTCVISGTPTTVFSSTSYTITATNSAGSATSSVSLAVAASVPLISYSGATGTSGSVGVAMSVSPTTLNNQGAAITSCSASPALPAWASINSSTCEISGTPTAILSSTAYTITAINSAGATTSSVTLSVAASAPIISYSGAPGTSGSVGVAMSVSPTTLNYQGAAITSCSASPALPAWASINSSTCVISGTPTAVLSSTAYTITATNSAGSATSSVSLGVAASVPLISYSGATGTSGSVGVAMSVAPTTLNNQGAAVTSCSATPALPAWASINSSTCVISGTPTAILSSTAYTITATNSAGSATSSVSLAVTASVPLISYSGAVGTSGSVGVAMSVSPTTLNNQGAAITSCNATPALPAWASINSSTCEISGTPTAVLSSSVYTITAINSAGATTSSVTLSVAASAPIISYSGAAGTSGSVGVAMSVSPTTLNYQGSCVISPLLPSWASINSSTCVISGIPTAILSSTSYTVTATNSAGSTTSSVTLSVVASAPIMNFTGATGTSGSVGVAMSVLPTTLNESGASITSCSASPALPAWASINSSTCVITGTPTDVLTSTSYTITAINSAGSATSSVTLSVAASAPIISYSGATGTSGSVGVAMSVAPTTLNNQGAAITSCSASPALPAWASINSSTCVISGTPTAVLSSTAYTITATNSVGSTTSSVSLAVAASVPLISFSGATGTSGSVGIAMSVAPTTLNNQGAVITSCSATPALPAWASINSSTCVISGTPTATLSSTAYTITATNSAGSATSSVSLAVAASGPLISYSGATGTSGSVGVAMSVSPTTLNNQGAAITSCNATPALPAWASINSSTCEISGTPTAILSSTSYTITATNSAGSSNSSVSLSVSASVPNLSYLGSLGTNGAVGVPLVVNPSFITSNGSAITNCSASPALPTGLVLNSSTCVISGTPTVVSFATIYSITAANAAGSGTASVTLSVSASAPAISYSGATGTSGSVGIAMSVSPTTLNNQGAVITSCSATPALPAWASINSSTCVISGTPTAVFSSTSYTVTATNSVGSSSTYVALSVAAAAPTISYSGATGTSGSVGVAMSVSPTTLNNQGAVITSCSATPALPAWASINSSTCVISGTPTAVLTSTSYTITATNSAGSTTSSVSLAVTASVPLISYSGATGTSGSVGVAMSVSPPTLNNQGAAITSCSATPALPAWASINSSTCVISGTPTSALNSTLYTITAINSVGSATSSVTLSVAASAPIISYSGATGTSGSFGMAMSVAPTTLNNQGAVITSCSANPALPAWASLNSSTCVISGTPTAVLSSTAYTITATNSVGSTTSSVSLAVAASGPLISYSGATGTSGSVGVAMSVSPTTLNNQGAAITSCSASPALPAWASINSSTCEISGTPTTVLSSTSYTITATNSVGSGTSYVALSVAASVPILSYLGSLGTNGAVGVTLSVSPSFITSNGSAITSCSASPALPTGLVLNSSTCVISGIPTVVSFATIYSITAANAAGSATATVTLSVSASAPAISYSGATGTSGSVGIAMSVSPTTLNNQGAVITSCSATPALPAWASINNSTCVISGTPTAILSSTAYTITATNSIGSTISSVSLTVIASAPVISYSGATGTSGSVGEAMSVSPTTLNNQGAAITSCSANPTLPAWASINSSTCVISGTPTSVLSSTVYTITAVNSGGSATSSVILNVIASAPVISYSGATGTSGSVGVAMSVSPTTLNNQGAVITSCSVTPALPAWASINTSTCVISGTPTAILSSTSYTITATNSAGSTTSSVSVAVGASVPLISYSGATGTSGSVAVPISVSPTTLNARGAAITSCSASPALPAWASINSSTCVISGTPTSALNSILYTITVTNSAGSATSSVTLSVAASAPIISYSGATGTSGSVGVAMSVSPTTLSNQGAVITSCSVSPALPAWASINSSTCVISGTPTAVLSSTAYTITAVNSAGSATSSVTLSVAASAPVISYSGAAGTNGSFGVGMSVSPSTLSNQGAAITSCSATPALPAWASINSSTCVISGTPTALLSSTSYTVTATNSVGSTTTSVSLTVIASAPVISYSGATGTSGSFGVAMSVTPTTLNARGAAITSCSASPALPAWASINSSTCVISGTPTAAMSSTTYTISAMNTAGIGTTTVSLSVCPSNYLYVESNSSLGVTNKFCVSKYEMKDGGGIAVSQEAGLPWTLITQVNAKNACKALGSRYDLISNPEWMALAYEVENISSNWTGGAIASGSLYRGHSDNNPANSLEVTNTANLYNGTGNTVADPLGSGKEQRRTLVLASGQVIWDFAGNVYEWVDWTLGGSLISGPTTCSVGWKEIPLINCAALSAADYLPDNPGNITSSTYNSSYGLGQIYGGTGGASRRGGNWGAGTFSGIYNLTLISTTSTVADSVGFRCVYRP